MHEHDLIVIGTGSGQDVAAAAASQGLDVAIVEDGPLGGTCLNRGCIPSKLLIHRADVAKTIRTAERFGIDAEITDIDFAAMTREVSEEVDGDAAAIERGVKKTENMTLYREEGRFVDEKTVQVGDDRITADKILVAAGSRPFIPPIDGVEDVDYMTSTEALRREEQPDHLIIIGGGYIASELAYFYGALGTDITILEMGDTLIGHEDRDVKALFTELFQDRYNVHLGYKATQLSQDGDAITVTAENRDGDTVTVTGDALLIAAGRRPNSDRLQVEAAGIETDDRGFIETNDHLETSVDGVWALGDIAGNWMFKHAANYEAEVAYHNMFADHDQEVDYMAMPHAVFSDPQVAGVGKTEQELEETKTPYVTGTYEYARTGMGAALKEEDGFVKVLVHPETRKILGCHIIGPDAATLIHEVLVPMRTGDGTIDEIIDTIHIHPALSEVVHRAFTHLEKL